MSQAYPQFTPVQILEAGQRAFGEGRKDYAAQFFQHLIEHYSDTAEAAAARETMAQINGSAPAGQTPQAPQTPQAHPAYHNGASPVAAQPSGARPAPGYAPSAAANGATQGIQLSMNGANGHHHEHAASNGSLNGTNGVNGHAGASGNGYVPSLSAHDSQDRTQPPQYASSAARRQHGQAYEQPSISAPPASQTPAQLDVPRHMQRHSDAMRYQQDATAQPAPVSHRLLVPAPEKNYIIGRVIAGLLLLIGIVGILAGIVLVYAALTDPRLFAAIGITAAGQAVMFAGSVFVASLVALIASQTATAVFDGADAASDLARLERYKFGESDED